MKKPILFGFAALCVLSTPNLVDQFSYETPKSVYRTIASSEEIIIKDRTENFDKEHLESFIDGTREDLNKLIAKRESAIKVLDSDKPEIFEEEKDKLLSDVKNIQDGLNSIKKQITSVEEKIEDKENELIVKLKSDMDNNEEIVTNLSKRISEIKAVVRDVTACEFRNEIDELSAQIKNLLKDKEEAVAKVDKKEKDNKDDLKEERKDEDKLASKEENIPSRFQQILSMGMIFGQGFQTSFQMPGIGYFSNPFMNYNPLMSFNNSNSSWLRFMQQDFSGARQMMNHSSKRLGETRSFNNIAGHTPQPFIPNFNRTSIEAEAFSIN